MPLYSGNAPVLGVGAPISVAAAGTLVSGWVDARNAGRIRAIAIKGAGAGAPALSWSQATDASGTNSKSVSAWAVGSLSGAVIDIDNPTQQLDKNGGFGFVQATITVTGGAGTLMSLAVLAEDCNAA